MSIPQPCPPRHSSSTALIVAIATVFCFTLAAVVVVAVAIPDGGNAGSLAAILIGCLAPTIASLVTLGRMGEMSQQVSDVHGKTNDLTNGLMDSKIRAAVADVLKDAMVDDAARPQIEADRKRRDKV